MRTTIAHQYTTYPLRLSRIFRWDKDNDNRAYLYIMNSSPVLLAGDRIKMNLDLGANTGLYLTEQPATKVHAMPQPETIASIDFQITIGEAATLELIPEPIIFYQDAALTQKTKIAMHLEGQLNPFKNSQLFASMPIQASFYLVLPEVKIDKLQANLLDLEIDRRNIVIASTILPHNKGLLVRALANKTSFIKQYLKSAINCVRQQCERAALPYIAK
jgi:urease accessory protein